MGRGRHALSHQAVPTGGFSDQALSFKVHVTCCCVVPDVVLILCLTLWAVACNCDVAFLSKCMASDVVVAPPRCPFGGLLARSRSSGGERIYMGIYPHCSTLVISHPHQLWDGLMNILPIFHTNSFFLFFSFFMAKIETNSSSSDHPRDNGEYSRIHSSSTNHPRS